MYVLFKNYYILQSHGERELESLSFDVDLLNVGHMGAKM